MKKLLIALSFLLTLSFSATGVAAQVQAPDLDGVDTSAAYDVEGLQSVYDRTFAADYEAMLASPDADLENLDTAALMRVITIQGMTFDNEDNAKGYIDEMKEQFDKAAEEDPTTFEGMELTDIEDFDVEGVKITMDMPDLEMGSVIYVFVDGSNVFQVMTIDGNLDDANTSASEVTQFVIDAEIESDEVSLSEDGTSTGGVFDKFPTAEDEVVGDLTGVTDSELFVAGE